MKHFEANIEKIADSILKTRNQRASFAESMKQSFLEKILFYFQPIEFKSYKVAAVDGGCIEKALHGYDIMLIRAAGVCFTYSNRKIKQCDYFPSKFPSLIPHILESSSENESRMFSSLERQNLEIRTAIECMKRFNPDFLLMDGLLFPHQSSKPPKTSTIYISYETIIQSVIDLFKTAIETKTILAGIIEDSRSNVFCNYLKTLMVSGKSSEKELLLIKKSRDTSLLDLILEKGNMTVPRKYAENPKEHPLLRDLPETYTQNLFYYYIKTARDDRPIKVDFLHNTDSGSDSGNYTETAKKLSSVLLQVSGHHPDYGIPAPIIQADQLAKLSEKDMENYHQGILRKVGKDSRLLKLRRDRRPL